MPEFTYVHARRLLALADLVASLPPKRFDCRQWVGDNWKGNASLSCGTNACMLGWATTMPSLRRLGLRLIRDKGYPPTPSVTGYVAAKSYEDVAAKLFGLDAQEAALLFMPAASWACCTSGQLPEDVSNKKAAAHVRKFVKRKLREQKLAARKKK